MADIELVINVPEGMTREEIENTPELVDFMLDECVTADTRMKVHKRLEKLCKLAIKALEQEPCDKYIKEIDHLRKYIYKLETQVVELDEVLDTRWIPVSDGLPKLGEEVIVTDVETSDTYMSRYIGNEYWECDNGLSKNRIIAWQPKPHPYEAESEE